MAQRGALYERALKIKEEALGPEHPTVAATLNNLGALLASRGIPAEARIYFQRALAIQEKSESPDLASALGNVAATYGDEGNVEKAMPYALRAVETAERLLGPKHPGLASNIRKLSQLHHMKGEHKKAMSSCSQALRIDEGALDPTHLAIADDLDCLGEEELELKRAAKALVWLERALALRLAGSEGRGLKKLATTRFLLAQALWEQRTDRKRALKLAQSARKGFSDEEADHELKQVEEWLSTRG